MDENMTNTVILTDEDGKEIEFVAKDFFARVICHELDHLDGILIVDKSEE